MFLSVYKHTELPLLCPSDKLDGQPLMSESCVWYDSSCGHQHQVIGVQTRGKKAQDNC